MKHKLKWVVLCFGLLLVYFNCQKDDTVVKETDLNQSQQITPTIKTVSYDNVGTIFGRLKSEYKLDGFLQSNIENDLLAV